MSEYLMESPDEGERLEAKEDARATRRQLRWARVSPGMRVLDAGAGSGVVARELAKRVGPSGQVVALERSKARAAFAKERARADGLNQLQVVQADLSAAPLPSDRFDLVWSRFVFEYLAEPAAALQELVRVTRPGGRVVVVDLDGNGMFHHPISPALEEALGRLRRALQGRLDPFVGRKLFSLFHEAGLRDVEVHAVPHHLYAGAAEEGALANWRYKLKTLAPVGERALGGRDAYWAFAREFLELLANPDTLTYSVLFWVGGTKP